MLERVFVKRVNQNAKLPTRVNNSDAGADVYYCGENSVVLEPNNTVLLGTGLNIATPHGFVCEVKNRSGMAAKKHLIVGACVIDSGYAGEVKINLHNVGNTAQEIHPGDKIAQILFYPVGLPVFEELPENEELYSRTDTNSSRADNGFGSSGAR